VFKINYQIKNILGNLFQAILTIFLFLIIVDVILLVMGSIFPFQVSNRLIISQFDLIVSIILILLLGVNYLVFIRKNKDKNELTSLKNIIIVILAIIPFEFIFLSLFGSNMGFYTSILLYILRISHLIGLLLILRIIGSKFISFSRKNGLDYGIVAITSIFIICSVLFFIFEGKVNPNIIHYEDAIWFSLVSITTTGFGDISPVTLPGRVVTGFLMVSGVSFAAFATASVAGSIVTKMREEKFEREKKIEEFNEKLLLKLNENQKELSEIKEKLVQLENLENNNRIKNKEK